MDRLMEDEDDSWARETAVDYNRTLDFSGDEEETKPKAKETKRVCMGSGRHSISFSGRMFLELLIYCYLPGMADVGGAAVLLKYSKIMFLSSPLPLCRVHLRYKTNVK